MVNIQLSFHFYFYNFIFGVRQTDADFSSFSVGVIDANKLNTVGVKNNVR